MNISQIGHFEDIGHFTARQIRDEHFTDRTFRRKNISMGYFLARQLIDGHFKGGYVTNKLFNYQGRRHLF